MKYMFIPEFIKTKKIMLAGLKLHHRNHSPLKWITNFPNYKTILYFVLLLWIFSSCVPNRKIVYLQKDDLKVENPSDTILRSYDLKKEEYRLQPEDIISIRVASVTDNEYNFIKQYETDLGIIRKLEQYKTESGSQTGGNRNNQLIGGGSVGGVGGGMSAISLDQLNTGFALDKNGELELPQVGVVKLSGLTIPEAEDYIKSILEGYFETPMIRIQLLNFHFTILGEVEEQGRYTTFDPELNLLDAFILAGNLTEFADRSNIKIVRHENGEAKILYLDVLDESLLSANNFYLKKNDLIIVSPLPVRTTNQYTLPNISKTFGLVGAAISLTALIITLSK